MTSTLIRTTGRKLHLAGLFMIMVGLLFSCGKDEDDLSYLLSTIPSSAGCVIGINTTSLLQDIGVKVEDGKLKPSKDTQNLLNSLPENNKNILSAFVDGQSGVDPRGAVLFYDLNRTYITFGLSDTEAFKNFYEKQSGQKFSETKGVAVCGNAAVKGAQVWLAIQNSSIDPVVINGYASLSESQSFLKNKISEKVASLDKDFNGWAKISVLTNNTMNFHQTTMFNLFSASLFDDAEDIFFTSEFEKGKFKTKLNVLNEKGKPAKYLLPTDKIDGSTIEALDVNSNIMVGAAISSGLVKQLDKLGTTLAGVAFSGFSQTIESVDGTVAVGFSNPDNMMENFKGVVTTNGDGAMKLKVFLSNISPLQEEGRLIKFGKGTMSGSLSSKLCGDMLKGACVGIISDFPLYPVSEMSAYPATDNTFSSIEYFCLRMVPDDESVALELIVASKDKGSNFLMTILKDNVKPSPVQ